MATLNIPDDILETFRCSVCRHYLSSAPVQVLPDGKSICSVCSPSSEQSTYRELTLEALLSKLSFPCQFKEYGCQERLLFDHTSEHEGSCAYRPFVCPMLPAGTCLWEGSAVDISSHFTNEHVSFVKRKAKFKLLLDQDKQGIFMVVVDSVPLIIKHRYSARTSDLRYDIRYFTSNVQATCKIQLTNDVDQDFNVSLKSGPCRPFSFSFYNMQDPKVLNLNTYIQVLDNPNSITVTIKVIVSKSSDGNAVEMATVNHKLLQSLQCKRCEGYLIPPLFADLNGGAICWYCHQKFKGYDEPLHDDKLGKLAADANFPCRWHGCTFVGRVEKILRHTLGCQFRTFNCKDCEGTFTWIDAVAHVQNHGYKYFTDTFVYKMKLCSRRPARKNIFTVKNDEIVVIEQGVWTCSSVVFKNVLNVNPRLIDGYTSKMAIRLEIEHDHCRIKSKIFSVEVDEVTTVSFGNLPSCFKYDEELTVTVKA